MATTYAIKTPQLCTVNVYNIRDPEDLKRFRRSFEDKWKGTEIEDMIDKRAAPALKRLEGAEKAGREQANAEVEALVAER